MKQNMDKFYVGRTVQFGLKLYNDQRNAQVFTLFIYSRTSIIQANDQLP
jgi:hypothetical protein